MTVVEPSPQPRQGKDAARKSFSDLYTELTDGSDAADLEGLAIEADHVEWWTWPEAIAWVDGRDMRALAILRQYQHFRVGETAGAPFVVVAQAHLVGAHAKDPITSEVRLIAEIEGGHVRTSGRRSRGERPSLIDIDDWRGAVVKYDEGTANLRVAVGETPLWFDIAVHRSDLKQRFAQLESSVSQPAWIPTGDPGRPTKGFHLYAAEHERRCNDGEALIETKAEAEYLASWFKKNYPTAAQPTATTVRNRIAERHRAYQATGAKADDATDHEIN